VTVEPVPGEPAAVADCGDERLLVVADYHAGLELSLRREGVELRSRANERRKKILGLLDRTTVDEILFLGDLANAIGAPKQDEARELRQLLTALTRRVSVTVVKGNHDGDIETVTADIKSRNPLRVIDGPGIRVGNVGFAHGHTWPTREVLAADVVCTAHEHPVVRLEDEVGGTRIERVWLRGGLDPTPFTDQYTGAAIQPSELVVFPGFNDLSGGTWVNVDGQSFLSPFLPEGLARGEAYLLDGTRLGGFQRI
jgi:putative SbcD/Mre11-related phosphoesterase